MNTITGTVATLKIILFLYIFNYNTVARLPTPLATLFEKLTLFAEQNPEFSLSVRVAGDPSLGN
jgi:hypothetical protein